MKSKETDISIIMPVYNGEKFLKVAIESILAQSFERFELIIINDGSTDASSSILSTYKDRDARIIIIEQENKGICCARNIGIDIARGTYLMFCDHDDTYEPEYLQEAYAAITTSDADFVKFGCREIYMVGDEIIRENCCILIDSEFVNNDVADILFLYSDYNEYIWDGIYKQDSIIKAGKFDISLRAGCEDIDIFIKLLAVCKKCKTINKIFYNHYIRSSTSTSRKYSKNTNYAVLRMYTKRLQCVNKNSNNYKVYCIKKTKQLLWALMGMFSFINCPLKANEIADSFKSLFMLPEFAESIIMCKFSLRGKENIVIDIFKLRLYYVLASACYLKRKGILKL